MNKQELNERMKGFKKIFNNKVEYIELDTAIELISRLDEPQKPIIPQFVADWIEKIKKELSLRKAMSQGYAPHEVDSWLREMDQDGACLNQELFARAWLDGYEVEKEPKYTVKIKSTKCSTTSLVFSELTDVWLFSATIYQGIRFRHTRKELEDAGFGWVFDCEGIEIEEVGK